MYNNASQTPRDDGPYDRTAAYRPTNDFQGQIYGPSTRDHSRNSSLDFRNHFVSNTQPMPSQHDGAKGPAGYYPTQHNEYELASFRSHENPFESRYEKVQQYPYQEEPVNPFTTANFFKPQPPLPLSEDEKIRLNEKERLRQLRRVPRFHFSRLPYFGILVTFIQVIVFIVELIKMAQLTGSAFQTKPYFNPMLGPSTYLLINMGARYVPCMNRIQNITNDLSIQYPCPNSTSIDTNVCSLNELCGLSGIPIVDNAWDPHQWYRVITPIFLHAGFLHIIFNLLLQISMGFTIERQIGIIKYAVIYLLSGVSGFLLGANFSPNGIASTGGSGSLFGIVAANIIMFVYCGKKNTNMYGTKRFGLFLFIMIMEIVVSFVLGLLPGLDNFSHIGGFAIGLLASVVLLQDPFFVYIDGIITYHSNLSTWDQFLNNWNPLHNWEDKIPSRFYIWCAVRVVCAVLIVLYFALLSHNFFGAKELDEKNNCSWCKYINCIPVNGWCDVGNVSIQPASQTTASSPSTASAVPTYTNVLTTITSDVPATPLPSSIENNADNDFIHNKRSYFEVFGPESTTRSLPNIQSADKIFHASNVGVIIIMTLLSVRFWKRRSSH